MYIIIILLLYQLYNYYSYKKKKKRKHMFNYLLTFGILFFTLFEFIFKNTFNFSIINVIQTLIKVNVEIMFNP